MLPRLCALAFLAAACVGLGCDRTWDFECTAVWSIGNIEASRELFNYTDLIDEKAATARCKTDAFEHKPKKANSMTCKCVGKD